MGLCNIFRINKYNTHYLTSQALASEHFAKLESSNIITDILGKIEFSVKFEITSKNTWFTIKFKSEIEAIPFLWIIKNKK